MSAAILPDPETDGPAAERAIEEAKSEVFGHLPDYNESTLTWIETKSELDESNEREARRQAKRAEAKREHEAPAAAQQPSSAGVDRGESPAESRTPLQSEYRAGAPSARDQLELLDALVALNRDEQQRSPALSASDAADDEVEFFRNPKEAVARAVENHPAMAALKNAARETYERKTAEQFREEFPRAEEWMSDPEFRSWVGASKVRMSLLRSAHEGYDLDAAREVFGNWKALRGAAQSASKTSAKVYKRSDVRRLMIENPSEYEAMADDIAAAYASGRVR